MCFKATHFVDRIEQYLRGEMDTPMFIHFLLCARQCVTVLYMYLNAITGVTVNI